MYEIDFNSLPRDRNGYSNLSRSDWIHLFGATGFEDCIDHTLVESTDLKFRQLSKNERDQTLLFLLKNLERDLDVAGAHRVEKWVQGWSEIKDRFVASGFSLNALRPQFLRPNEMKRLGGDFVCPASGSFEAICAEMLRGFLFRRYLRNVGAVYEFGAGTGINLVSLAKIFPDKRLYGLDWVAPAVDIYELLRINCGFNIQGRKFDFAYPDKSLVLENDSAVLTFSALEQVGERFHEFLNFIAAQRPRIVIHAETIYELYDTDSLFDWTSIRYLEKRGYLRGLLAELRRREEKGELRIVDCRRTFGGQFHEGYSVVVWEPC